MKKILIAAGEASGDMHGANLVRAMLDAEPALSFHGMGGGCLRDAGVDILFAAERVSVVGIAEVFSRLPDILAARRVMRDFIRDNRPDLLIIIDFPDFNLMLAKYAKKYGVPVFYYICPQVWAWRSGRVKKISKLVDLLGVILPFEEQFFRERQVAAHYVGHPLLDSVRPKFGRERFLQMHGLAEESLLIGIIPGSREREISSLLPVFLDSARQLEQKIEKDLVFVLPRAATVSMPLLEENGLGDFIRQGYKIIVVSDAQHEAMAACHAVMAASGTVTLELALLDTPLLAAYKISPKTYLLLRHILRVKVDNFSLVNLIAGQPFIAEFLQEQVNADMIAAEIFNILTCRKRERMIKKGLAEVRQKLGGPGASARAAGLALELIKGYGRN